MSLLSRTDLTQDLCPGGQQEESELRCTNPSSWGLMSDG
jgi:hypothetical protein